MHVAATLVLCLASLWFAVPAHAEEGHSPSWGASVASVLAGRAPSSFFGESGKSLLFSVPVYVLQTKEVVSGRSCSVLYSFWKGGLLEYMVFFHGEKESLYRELRNCFLKRHQPYEGPYFTGIEDAFISKDGSTLYLLLSGRETMLYVLDARAYDTFMRGL